MKPQRKAIELFETLTASTILLVFNVMSVIIFVNALIVQIQPKGA